MLRLASYMSLGPMNLTALTIAMRPFTIGRVLGLIKTLRVFQASNNQKKKNEIVVELSNCQAYIKRCRDTENS